MIGPRPPLCVPAVPSARRRLGTGHEAGRVVLEHVVERALRRHGVARRPGDLDAVLLLRRDDLVEVDARAGHLALVVQRAAGLELAEAHGRGDHGLAVVHLAGHVHVREARALERGLHARDHGVSSELGGALQHGVGRSRAVRAGAAIRARATVVGGAGTRGGEPQDQGDPSDGTGDSVSEHCSSRRALSEMTHYL